MHFIQYFHPAILALLQFTEGARKHESILLSKVKTLTLRKDLKTSYNRIAPIPQVRNLILRPFHTESKVLAN